MLFHFVGHCFVVVVFVCFPSLFHVFLRLDTDVPAAFEVHILVFPIFLLKVCLCIVFVL